MSQNNSCLEFIHENSVIEKLLNEFSNVFSEKKAAFLANTA